MTILPARWLGLIAMAAIVTACEDDASTGVDDGGNDAVVVAPDGGGPGADLGADGSLPGDGGQSDSSGGACPAGEPAAGAACASEGLRCAFDTEPACGDVWECVDKAWMVVFDGPDCSAGDLFACPDEPPTGFCIPADSGECRYDVTVCRCETRCTGMRPRPGEEFAWSCAVPQSGACPPQPPEDATSCKHDGLQCSYGNCGGQLAVCTDGRWVVKSIPAPP